MPSTKTSRENVAKARAKMAEIVKKGKEAEKKARKPPVEEEPESEYSDEEYEYEYVDQSEEESESEE